MKVSAGLAEPENSLVKTTDGGQTWTRIFTPGYTSDYWWIDFLNEDYGFIAANGKVIRTTDGGNTWDIIQAGDNQALFSIDLIDSLHIAAAGYGGTNYSAKNIYSSNGGNNWVEGQSLTNHEINCIKYISPDIGYMTMSEIGMYKTTNRGQEWIGIESIGNIGEFDFQLFSEVNIGYSAGTGLKISRTAGNLENWHKIIINDDFTDVFFTSEQKGFVLRQGTYGMLFRTMNGGMSWDTIPGVPGGGCITFTDSLTGYIGTTTSKIYKTTDGGENWYETNGITNTISKIFFIDSQTGWAAGGPRIFKTTDGGENWVEQLDDIVAYFYSIFFVDSLNGWAVSPTYNGIYSTFDGGISWIERTDIPIYEANDIYFSDSINGWIISANELYRTLDSGNSWFLDPQIYTYTTHFETISKNHFIITGTNIYESIDTGQVWQNITNEIGDYFTSLQAPENYLAFSVGPAGLILKYLDTSYVPVELKSLSTKVINQNVYLYWITATETNNKEFEVEKGQWFRINGKISWEKIGFVEGNGTTTKINHYSFIDQNVLPGKYIYRLKQIDYDGNYKYSKEIEVNVTVPSKFSLEQNFPNPFNPETNISFTISEETNVSIKLYDITGREIKVLVNEKKQPGYYTIKLKGGELSSGVYFYRLITGSGYTAVKKLILLK